MEYELESLSRAELEQLRADVEAALSTLSDRERKAALEAAQQAAMEHGFSLEELTATASGRGRGKAKAKRPAKFRNPDDPNQTWTGRGRKPQWIKAAEEAGLDLSKFEI